MAESLPKPRLKKKVKAGRKRKRLVVLAKFQDYHEKNISWGKVTP